MNNDNQSILEKEIDLIQACIERMSQNSFMVKGWAIALIAVVLALLPETVDLVLLGAIGVVATLCFWYLDAFFLRTERLYRWKYEWVITKRTETNKYCYNLNPYNKHMWLPDEKGRVRKKPCIVRIMFTQTLTPIYIPLVTISMVTLIIELVKRVADILAD